MFKPSLEELVSTTIYLVSAMSCKIHCNPSALLLLPFLCRYLSELKLEAVTMTSSLFWTNTGIFRQPGDFNNLCNNFSVSVDTHTRTDSHKISHECKSKKKNKTNTADTMSGKHYTSEQTADILKIMLQELDSRRQISPLLDIHF